MRVTVLLVLLISVASASEVGQRIELPSPELSGDISVEQAIRERRSERDFRRGGMTVTHVSQVLWAAQGTTDREGYRAAPSAGGLYPLEIYLVAGNVEGLDAGVYRYRSKQHDLVTTADGDHRKELSAAALDQEWVRRAPAVLVITAVYQRTTRKYGQRGNRYVHMEVGFAAENVYLQAEALGLGTVMVGAFHDDQVKALLNLPPDHDPLALMPLGRER